MHTRRFISLVLVLSLIIGVILFIQNRGKSNFLGLEGDPTQLGPVSDAIAGTVGDKAIDFVLLDYANELVSLSDYSGRPIVLNFWASWCPFCTNELPDFQKVYADQIGQGSDIVFIGVNRGESQQVAQLFTDEMNLTFPLLVNRADDVSRAYNLRAMPSTYFIDRSGVIVDIKRGPMEAPELKMRVLELTEGIPMDETLVSEDQVGEVELPTKLMNTARTIQVTEGVKHSIPLGDIRGGGPPKDGIPSIDSPNFVSIAEANEYINDDGLGIALSFNGIDRFYPFQIIVWHEIVNDNIGGQAALVTYCPLCGTGIVFDPIVNGKVTAFGTSGKLWNSNLIMYDRQTDSYWSQVLGEAVVGEQTGTKLSLLSHQNLLYKDWKDEHPNGEVLSKDTGSFRDYSTTPYGDYDSNKSLFFPVDNENDSYHPKTPTYQIEVNGVVKIYPIEELDKGAAQFDDTVGDVVVGVVYNKQNKTVKMSNKKTGAEIVPFYGFWFSVISVHPNAEVYTFSK
jgi:peroxiredoxin